MKILTNKESLYEKDFLGWCIRQSCLLKEKKFNELDMGNLAEEIESMGRREKINLRNRLSILFCHILKYIYQQEKRSRSWTLSIEIQREESLEILRENPSLKPMLKECCESAYKKARLMSSEETGIPLKEFPEVMPFSVDMALTEGWMPNVKKIDTAGD